MTRRRWFEFWLIVWIAAWPVSFTLGYVARNVPEPTTSVADYQHYITTNTGAKILDPNYVPAQPSSPVVTTLNVASTLLLIWLPLGWIPVLIAHNKMNKP